MPTFPAKARAAYTLVCLLHRAVCFAQSQNSAPFKTPLEIPVTGENLKDQVSGIKDKSVQPSRIRKQKFKDAQKAVEEPSSSQINQEKLEWSDFKKGEPPSATFFDSVRRLKSAEVKRYGGFGAVPFVRFRGARALEPQYFWNGISLTGVFTGEQNTELLPTLGLESLTAYPDTAPFWFTRNSIAGAINLKSCSEKACLSNARDHFRDQPLKGAWTGAKVLLRTGSNGFRQAGAFAEASPEFSNSKHNISAALGHTQSRDDFDVKNNNGTVQRTDDDFSEKRRNNDFQRWSGAGHWSTKGLSWGPVGEVSLDAVGGSENRGIPGAVGTDLSNSGNVGQTRLNRSLALVSLSTRRLWADSGAEMNSQMFLRRNASRLQNKIASVAGQSPSDANLVGGGAKIWLRLPWEAEHFRTSSGVAFGAESNSYRSEVSNSLNVSEANKTTAQDTRGNLGVFQSVTVEPLPAVTLTAVADATLNIANVQSRIGCQYAVGFPQCGKTRTQNGTSAPSASLSLQTGWQKSLPVVSFVRISQSERSPNLVEQFGSAEGLVANVSLKSETSRTLEVGIATEPVGAVCYFTQDKNLIFAERLNPAVTQYRNLGAVLRRGCTLDGSVQVWRYLVTDAGYQLLATEITPSQQLRSTELPRSSRHLATGGIAVQNYPLTTGLSFLGSAYFRAIKQSPFYLDTANRLKLTLPVQLDAGGSVRFVFVPGGRVSSVTAAIDLLNFTNSTTATQLDSTGRQVRVESSGFAGYPMAGRSLVASLVGEF